MRNVTPNSGAHRRPHAVQAAVAKGDAPEYAGAIQRLRRRAAHQTGRVEHHQRQRLIPFSPGRQREAGRRDPVQLPLPQRSLKRRAQTAIPRQRQIQLAFQHPVDQLGITRDARLDPHLWIGAREAAQHLRQKRLAEILLQPPATVPCRSSPRTAAAVVIKLQQAARVAKQSFPVSVITMPRPALRRSARQPACSAFSGGR